MRDIKLEIFEGERCTKHKLGEKYNYPADANKICTWLLSSANAMIQVLRYDGRLGWSYKGTPYEKIINKDGVTTEFVRCPDPTKSGIVLKINDTARRRKKKV